jgi:hypothetical protein
VVRDPSKEEGPRHAFPSVIRSPRRRPGRVPERRRRRPGPVATYVFATKSFEAPAGRTIRSVKLPDDADLHVFTVAVN